jgi:Na+/melibiose symporter-like transporter
MTRQQAVTRHVPTRTIHLYSMPNLALSVATLPTAVYLSAFYAQNLGLSLAMIGTIALMTRVLDVFVDPVIGMMSDRSRSSWGRRKPWIAMGVPLKMITVWLLWVPPAFVAQSGETVGLLYLAGVLFAYYVSTTLISIPYSAWGADLSPDYRERSLITGIREMWSFIGLISVLALPVVMTMMGHDKLQQWVQAIAVAVAIVLPILFIPALRFVKEPPHVDDGREHPTWWQGLRIVWRNGPFKRLSIIFILLSAATSMTASLSLLYMSHGMGQARIFPIFVMCYYLSSVVGIPVWVWISRRLGKHKATTLAIFWLSLWSAPIPFIGADHFWIFFVLMLLKGSAVGALYFLPSAMAADVVDIDTLRTGKQRSGLYFSLWSMALKLSGGIGIFLASLGVEAFGFNAKCASPALANAAATCTNTQDSIFWLASFYSIIPAILALFALTLMWRYPVTEERQRRIREVIARRNAARATAMPDILDPNDAQQNG